MTRVEEFDNFYTATSADALRVAYALCGDRQLAIEATVDAYRRGWRDWSKIRDRRPLEYVRNEAWRATGLNRGAHPLRKRQEPGADAELNAALQKIPANDRRLIVLLTLGGADLTQASREVGVGEEEGIERVGVALSSLEQALGEDLATIESRLSSLGSVTESLTMPPAENIRSAARRGTRLNTIALVVAAVAVMICGGIIVTDGDSMATQTALPYREKLGSERPDVILEANKISGDNLLSSSQVAELDPSSQWRTVETDEDPQNQTPYATCPTRRFADDNPLRVFLRTFESKRDTNARVAQSIEVSRSNTESTNAFESTMNWYANCAHPRVQLVGSYIVERPFGDFRIMRLRSHRDPERTFTVGFTHSGSVNSTVVHEQDGERAPSIDAFARLLNTSVAKICTDSGGKCSDKLEVVAAPPPPTDDAPEFLGIVDLPPVGDVDSVWSGADPFKTTKKRNPATTVCDNTDPTTASVRQARSRLFVIPQAERLPEEFGLAETVYTMKSGARAKKLTSTVRDKLAKCAKDNPSAKVDDGSTIKGEGIDGTTWTAQFEVKGDDGIIYRTGVVRRGKAVAQVLFTSTADYDISQQTFDRLVKRAGQRLTYIDD